MSRPSTQYLNFDMGTKLAKTTSTNLSPIKQTQSLHHTKKQHISPILTGFENVRYKKKVRHTHNNRHTEPDKSISK